MHFHTEKSGETFLLFDIKISSASNACEGKYLWQNIPLPISIRHFDEKQLIKENEHCYGHFILQSLSSCAWIF